MASSIRQQKIADAIKRELGKSISMEIRDPDRGFITVTTVRVTKDMGIAYIYITVFGDSAQEEKSLAVLARATGFLRSALAQVLKSRKVPHLKFFIDDTLDYFNTISETMDEINSKYVTDTLKKSND